jgi:tetratricopeptide (TPR) repeat protein
MRRLAYLFCAAATVTFLAIASAPPNALGQQHPAPAPIQQTKLTAAQWREDLRYFAVNMEKTHRNLFHTMKREQFEAAIKQLDERIPSLADHEILVELMRIVAMIGDGHTHVRVTQQFKSVYPLRLYQFKDGLFVQAAAPEYRAAVGARVMKIGNLATNEALNRVREIAWHDNEMGIKSIAPKLLVIPEVLHALRIANDLQSAAFVLEKDGRETTLELKPSGQVGQLFHDASWVDMRAGAKSATPLWLAAPQTNFWFEHLKEPNLLYVQYNAVQDKPAAAGKPGETVEAFFNRVFDYIETNRVDKLVLDLRLNGGGNNYLNLPLTIGTIKSRVNQRGKLFVIIGRETFSAAQNAVNELEKYTKAIFVGEPTAGNPNHYGDARPVELPNSKIVIQASTLWWQDEDPRDRRPWTAPEIAAELTSSDYMANVDPAMKAVMNHVPGNTIGELIEDALKSTNVQAFTKKFRTYKTDPAHVYVETETAINQLGYNLMGRKRIDDAIEVFKLNVEDYPNSANVYDSLAEAYLNKGDKESAIKFYEKAVATDPNFASSIEALRKLKN